MQFCCKLYIPQNENILSTDIQEIEKILDKQFEGWTRYFSVGAWKGTRESVYVYEIITDEPHPKAINWITDIMLQCGEEAAMWTMHALDVNMVTHYK